MQAPDPYTEYYLKDNLTFETFMDACEAVTKKAADGSVEVAAWADKSEWGIENIRTRMLYEEAQDRRDEYIAKCDFAVPWVECLAVWYSDNRVKFLNIMWEGTNPAAAADQMKPLLNDSLRRTVG